ncbi:hypothetical protein B0T25DRAFT_87632 [Lasiosphaeria hispida]|uniref:Uncharacterized protein n=1 Tax=Lasiosphaeria hispida TaxID=260671 RepID=A0AAJ0MHH7_9PEZI|nr:hypothetical protein B0T25DRAFT_87632 [Lasiosphaeria hispida]
MGSSTRIARTHMGEHCLSAHRRDFLLPMELATLLLCGGAVILLKTYLCLGLWEGWSAKVYGTFSLRHSFSGHGGCGSCWILFVSVRMSCIILRLAASVAGDPIPHIRVHPVPHSWVCHAPAAPSNPVELPSPNGVGVGCMSEAMAFQRLFLAARDRTSDSFVWLHRPIEFILALAPKDYRHGQRWSEPARFGRSTQ